MAENKVQSSNSGLGDSLIISGLNGVIDSVGGLIGLETSLSKQKKYLDYQYDKYLSPKAQVRGLTEAGLNPGVVFGNDAPVLHSSPQNPSIETPHLGIGTTSLSDLANYLAASAEAKKKGVEIPNIEEDTRNKVLQNSRQEFENELRQKYGLRQVASEVALAEENVKLAKDQGDINQIEKAIKQWTEAKEKALKECSEHQRDILAKELDNTDTRLDLENLVKKTQSKANVASAASSYASAQYSKELSVTERKLRDGRIFTQSLENALKSIDYEVKDLTKFDTVGQIKDEAARVHKMLERGDVLGKYLPQDIKQDLPEGNIARMLEDSLTELWLKYKHGVEVGKAKVESHKNK